LANQDCRVALKNSIGRQIFIGDGGSGHDGVRSDGNARTNPRTGPNPGAIPDGDGFHDQVERRQFVIVAAGAKEGAL
jgi:hypothetical protein